MSKTSGQSVTQPAIVFILEYTLPHGDKTFTFKEYVDYMQRKDATSMEKLQSEEMKSTEGWQTIEEVTELDYEDYLHRRENYLL